MEEPTNEPSAGPVFVCGASRSGTALVRSLLNNASDLHLAGETHYFDDLRVRLGGAARRRLDAGEARTAEDYFLALSHRPYGHDGDPERGTLDRGALRALAAELGGTADAHFEAYCRLVAREAGKARWGEKTPRHVYRLREVLEAYPDARAVCLVRDPRAVVLSYRDWRNRGGFDLERDPGHAAALARDEARSRRSYHPLVIAMLWRGTVRAAQEARARFGPERVRLQVYERLVEAPEDEARALAAFVGVPFTPALLDVPVHNSSFSGYDARGGVSRDALARWRERLSPTEIALVQAVCGERMEELGYPLEPVRGSAPRVAWGWATLPVAAGRALVANRRRIGGLPGYVLRRARLAVRT